MNPHVPSTPVGHQGETVGVGGPTPPPAPGRWSVPPDLTGGPGMYSQVQPEPYSPLLMGLLRTFRLVPYGLSGLTPAAYHDLSQVAMGLLVVWPIDFVALGFFINMLFHGGRMEVTWKSMPAALFGFLLATLIILYESKFVTTSLKRGGAKFSLAMRVLIIFVMAMSTSLPLDMIIFRDRIAQRIHEETVLKRLPRYAKLYQEADTMSKSSSDPVLNDHIKLATVAESIKYDSTAEAVKQGRLRIEQLAPRVSRQEAQVAGLQNRLRDEPDSERRSQLVSQLSSARGLATQLRAELAAAQNELEALQKQEMSDRIALERQAGNARKEFKADAEAEARRWEAFVHEMWNNPPLTLVVEKNTKGSKGGSLEKYDGMAEESGADLTERVIALAAMLEGVPPALPRMSKEDIEALKKMRLQPYLEGDQNGNEPAKDRAAQFRRIFYAITILLVLPPVFVLMLKLTFDPSTESYFDAAHQEAIGYPGLAGRGGVGGRARGMSAGY